MSKCKIIAIANQKGGVAKTTTTINLGAGLVRSGKKVLVIDFDEQGALTTSLGFNKDEQSITIKTLLEKTMKEEQITDKEGILTNFEGVDLIPANEELESLELHLVSHINREYVLANYLKKIKENYDYILIDCKPSLSVLTLNALATADSVIIPVQAQYLSINGMTQLIQTIDKVKAFINPRLKIEGILLTLVDQQTRLAKTTEETLRKHYGNVLKIFKAVIPVATKVAEASIVGKSIYAYQKNNKAAIAYENFIKEVQENREKTRNRDTKCR